MSVVSDIDPAHAPDWLLNIVAPVRGTRPATPQVYWRAHIGGEGSRYGLRALDNACAKLASAGPGERDRAVGENVLAIGSLAAGGELDEHHALQALKNAGQSNPGSDANYCDKIERAFETGKENPRSGPPRRQYSEARSQTEVKRRRNPEEGHREQLRRRLLSIMSFISSCPEPTDGRKKICVWFR